MVSVSVTRSRAVPIPRAPIAMPDLSIARCVFCRRPIGDERDGGVCDGCRHPIHFDCARPKAEGRDRVTCSVCGVNLVHAASTQTRWGQKQGQDGASADAVARQFESEYTNYAQVPWHRRSGTNNLFVALGLVGCLPLTLWVCFNLLTGDVYLDRQQKDGR